MEFSTSLKLNHIFRRLYSTSGHANTYLVLYARRNRSKENRVGLTCGKKLGHAVVPPPPAGNLPAQRASLCPWLRHRGGGPFRRRGCGFCRAGACLPESGEKGRDFIGGRPLKRLFLLLIRFYQKCISPYTPPSCRFTPTCSAYAYTAIQKYGALKGGYLALRRLLRCNPFYKGDYFDPVP